MSTLTKNQLRKLPCEVQEMNGSNLIQRARRRAQLIENLKGQHGGMWLTGLEPYAFVLSLYLLAMDLWQGRPISWVTFAAALGLILVVHASNRIRSNHIERRLNALIEFMDTEGQFEPPPVKREMSGPMPS